MSRKSLVLIPMLLCLFAAQAIAIEIPLEKDGGVYRVPVRIDDVITLNFILDSGASEVVIPEDVAMTLVRANKILETDFLPGKTYTLADGSQLKSLRFIIRELELGGIKINNVPASISPHTGDLLLGQNALEKLGPYTIDPSKPILIIGTSGSGTKNAKSVPPKTWEEQVAAPLRSVIKKAKKSPIPVYLPSFLEVKDSKNRPFKLFVLDNDTFPLSFGPDGYTIFLGDRQNCNGYYCLAGLISAEVGLTLRFSDGESIALPYTAKAVYRNSSGGKAGDEVIFFTSGISYTFELGLPGEGREVNIRIAESALRLGPLPRD
jgi:hypothetical protein